MRRAALLLPALVAAAACGSVGGGTGGGPGTAPGGGPHVTGGAGEAVRAAADTLRGVVAVVGAEPLTRVVLRTDRGSTPVEGGAVPLLERLAGLEVRIQGRGRGDSFFADSLAVRGFQGHPAADGTLEVEDGEAVLVRPDGARTRFSTLPSALRHRVGHWVWIAGAPGSEPEAWGVIRPD